MRHLFYTLTAVLLLTGSVFSQDTIVLKKYFGNLKQVSVSINGKPFNFLFDTGGGETFISPEVANYLDKQVYGNSTGFRMTGEIVKYKKCDNVSFKINSIIFNHQTIGVWDISGILPKELPKIDGLLSLKSFSDRIVTLDLRNDKIILETPASYKRKIKEMTLLNSRFSTGQDGNESLIFLSVPHLKHAYWFLFDSGNLGNVLLSRSSALEWGFKNDTLTQQNELGKLSIPLGKESIKAEASSESLIYDGSLNYDLISQYVFLINSPKRQIWMQ